MSCLTFLLLQFCDCEWRFCFVNCSTVVAVWSSSSSSYWIDRFSSTVAAMVVVSSMLVRFFFFLLSRRRFVVAVLVVRSDVVTAQGGRGRLCRRRGDGISKLLALVFHA